MVNRNPIFDKSGFVNNTMITNDKQIDSCLENLCQQGCRSVNQVIQQLEQGQVIETIAHLSGTQRQRLLQELKSIMAVYATTGSCEMVNG